jgi:hypothetical protein
MMKTRIERAEALGASSVTLFYYQLLREFNSRGITREARAIIRTEFGDRGWGELHVGERKRLNGRLLRFLQRAGIAPRVRR